MDHNLFKSKNFEEGRHSVVGDCNGIPMDVRWKEETPAFAKKILSYASNVPGFTILDYGCGVGRLAKEILNQNKTVTVIGLDDSQDQLNLAKEYVNDSRFIPVLPYQLNQKVDLVYCVYVLQHIPSIEIREAIQRIHTFLKPDGNFIYCSSDYRMAIRFDGKGFFDDRFLGVNIREEIGRLFDEQGDLFPEDKQMNEVVRKMIYGDQMIYGDLPHPAKVYKKKAIDGHLFNARKGLINHTGDLEIVPLKANTEQESGKKRLILRNRLSPGDVLVMTTAIRALHQAHPDKYETDVESPCPEIFENNPFITKLNGDGQVIDMQYPEIHKSGASGRHFSDGHRKYLEDVLEIKIPRVGLLPDIFLTQDEKLWPSPLLKYFDWSGSYIVLNAGSKGDYTLKQYHRWQEVVHLWNKSYPEIKLAQIGVLQHNHKPLDGALDMRGKTSIRELFRLIYHSVGIFTCVSFPMHIAAALSRPCVVVAGGREGTRWELYPDHRFLYVNGALDCCMYDGCWRSKIEECQHPIEKSYPLCLEMIRPEDVVRAMDLYVLGGVIKIEEKNYANA